MVRCWCYCRSCSIIIVIFIYYCSVYRFNLLARTSHTKAHNIPQKISYTSNIEMFSVPVEYAAMLITSVCIHWRMGIYVMTILRLIFVAFNDDGRYIYIQYKYYIDMCFMKL